MKVWQPGGHLTQQRGAEVGDWSWQRTARRLSTLARLTAPYKLRTALAIGSLLAQGLAPYAAARLGVYLHGLAGDAVRERIGDAGLLASDLPDAIAIARKRLAGIAERRAAGGKLGFTARLPGSDG